MRYHLIIESIAKRFGRQQLFKNLEFELETGQSLAISGPNSSGKTTLLQIIALLQRPDQGRIIYSIDGNCVMPEEVRKLIGYSSPLVYPYDDLSGRENIEFVVADRNNSDRIDYLLELFKLSEIAGKPTGAYSTGMLQRLRCALALVNDPPIVLLDEPGSNLDDNGKTIIYDLLKKIQKDKILIIASNDIHELKLCEKDMSLAQGNTNKS